MYNPSSKTVNPVRYLNDREYSNSPYVLKQAINARLNSAKSLYNKNLLAHFGCVNAIEFSNGGELLASGGDDRRVLVWNVEEALHGSGRPRAMRAQHSSNIFCLSYDSRNTKIFSAGNDDQVIVHDTVTGDPIDYFLHEQPVYSVSIDPFNDNVFTSACDDGRILVYDIRANTDPFALAIAGSAFHGVMFNPTESRLVATANAKDGAALWDIRKPKHALLRYGSAESCMSVRWDCHGQRLLALRRRLPPVLYPVHSPCYLAQFDHPSYYNSCTMKSCCFAGVNDQFVLSGSDDFNLYMWKVPVAEPGAWVSTAHLILTGHRSIVNQVRFNPVNNLIASSGVEKLIKVWCPFPLPNSKSDQQSNKSSRKVFSHEEYISLVLTSGQFISHDYSHQSTNEDPRMMAFFDSLVQREIEGWTSGDSHSEPPSPLASDHALSDDSSSSSDSENAGEEGKEGDTKNKHRATNPIVELIARKRAQLVRLAQNSCKKDANSDTSDSGAAVSSCRKHSCKRKRRRPRSSSSGSEDKSSPQSLPSTPSEKRRKMLVWCDDNSSDSTDQCTSSSTNLKEPSTSSETPDSGIAIPERSTPNKSTPSQKRKKMLLWDDENSSDVNDQGPSSSTNVKKPSTCSDTPDSGIALPQISTSSKHKPKARSHRNYRQHIPDSDSD